MPTPLVMLGSGDYATNLHVKGTRLLKTKGPQANTSSNPDPDQAPNHSGYHRPGQNFRNGKFSPNIAPEKRPERDPDSFNLTAPLHAAFAWLQLQSLALTDLADAARHDAEALPLYKAADAIGGLSSQPQPTPHHQPAFVRALRAAKAKLRAQQPAPRIVIAPIPVDFVDAHAPHKAADAIGGLKQPQPELTPRRDSHEPHPQTAQDPQPHPRNPLDPRLFADDAGARRRTGRLQSHRLRTRRSPDQKRSPQTAGQQSPLFGSVA
ncbi:MAG: hypothetical protein AAGH99_11975 [Planctomycetota bacterium]